ncbi:MAG: hypothetical protein WKF36_08010 [Candidatus Nitrosocosmicus sp.]
MKTAQTHKYGDSKVGEINQNAPLTPKPFPDKIIIGIKAPVVNPVNWRIREGH